MQTCTQIKSDLGYVCFITNTAHEMNIYISRRKTNYVFLRIPISNIKLK